MDIVAVGEVQEHEDLVAAVAMAMDLDGAVEDFRECFEAEVATGGGGRIFFIFQAFIFCPESLVVACFMEGPIDGGFDAHAGVGEAACEAGDVFAEGEFDSLGGVGEDQGAAWLSVAELDDGVLAADDVGGTVEEAGGGGAAGEGAEDVGVVAGDDVADADFGDDGEADFVDVSGDCHMRVGVDDSGHCHKAVGFDDGELVGRLEVGSDCGDFTILDEDGGTREGAEGF